MPNSSRAADTVAATGNDLIDGLLTNTKWKEDAEGGTTTITYSFPTSPTEYDGYSDGEEPSNGFLSLTDFQKSYFEGLLSNLSTVTNLNFLALNGASTGDATVKVGWTEDSDDGVVAWAYLPEDAPWAGDVWLNAKSFSPTSTKISDYEVGVLMHEFGHALGLKHPHQAEGDFGVLPAEWDGPEYTSMTYNVSADFKGAWQSDLYPQTYMWLDIQALQHLYGKNTTATAGNETYEYDLSERHYLTIWDAGGKDTISAINGSKDVDINLTPGTWSDLGTVVTFSGGGEENTREKTVFITPDTIIENASGAGGNDKLTGNDVANRLMGNAGDDTLSGGAGDDNLVGGTGDDMLDGGAGNDTMWAGAADTGSDHIVAGAGNDIVGGGGGDDFIIGDTSQDDATDGNDTLFGGEGNDTLIGSSWNDSNNNGSYDAGEATSGAENSNDKIWAGSGDDLVVATAGDDILGGGIGSDTIDGGDGDDLIYGGKASNGATANDVLAGGAGDDVIYGGSGDDAVTGDAGDDQLFGGAGNDTISGGKGDDQIYGGAGNDWLTGDSGADSFAFKTGHGDDQITDFAIGEDELFLSNTATDFTSLNDVQAAASQITIDGTSGLMINTGAGDSLFLVGLSVDDLTSMNITL